MWVIWDTFTGLEYDRVETHAEARRTIITLNGNAEGEAFYTLRWED